MSSFYTGHKPDGETKMHDLKCGVNTRMSLQKRMMPIQETGASQMRTRAQSAGANPDPIRSFFLQKRHFGETTYMSETKDYVRTREDAPQRKKEPTADVGDEYILPKFEATSTNQVANAGIADGFGHNFFTEARKVERVDDDIRRNVYIAPTRAGASHMQRTVDIMRKRETEGFLEPPKEKYMKVAKRPKNGLPPASAADRVRFTHISPLTSNQVDFKNPEEIISTGGQISSSNNATAAAVVAAAAAKSSGGGTTATVRPGTAAATNSNKKVDIHSIASRRAITTLSSSQDMFAGTAKAREDLTPGFMGHVPAHISNVNKVQGHRDILRLYSKCNLNVSSASQVNEKLVASNPDLSVNKAHTMQAAAEREVFANKDEQGMNKLVSGRQNAVRKFFSAGAGDADNTVADQFCTKFRPGGGSMKQGPSSSWGWISEAELKRKTVI